MTKIKQRNNGPQNPGKKERRKQGPIGQPDRKWQQTSLWAHEGTKVW